MKTSKLVMITSLFFTFLSASVLTENDIDTIEKLACKNMIKKRRFYDCERTIKFKRMVFKIKGKISNYYDGKDYQVLWIVTNNNKHVGCLASKKSNTFNNLSIGDKVVIKGNYHHIEQLIGYSRKRLILDYGCSVTKIKF